MSVNPENDSEFQSEIARLRLTDAEREAVESALWDLEQAPDDPGCASSAATLRGLLERLT